MSKQFIMVYVHPDSEKELPVGVLVNTSQILFMTKDPQTLNEYFVTIKEENIKMIVEKCFGVGKGFKKMTAIIRPSEW